MKTMGILGGMSWKSTLSYYQIMNEYIHELKGEYTSIEALIYSVNFAKIYEQLVQNHWKEIGDLIVSVAHKLELGGAEFVLMTSNAAHKVADKLEQHLEIPLLHIVDPTAQALVEGGIQRVGLLGTQVTMGEAFYRERLKKKWNIETIVPTAEDQASLNQILFEEVLLGKTTSESRAKGLAILEHLEAQGAKGVILGCTELNLMMDSKQSPFPLFDTTLLHTKAAVDLSLS